MMRKEYKRPFCKMVSLRLNSAIADDPTIETGQSIGGGNQDDARAKEQFDYWEDEETEEDF